MLLTSPYFSNYAEFKEMFGTPENRKNPIVLAFIKYVYANRWRNFAFNRAINSIIDKRLNLADIMDFTIGLASDVSRQFHITHNCDEDWYKAKYKVEITGLVTFWHSTIQTDDFYGVCEDMDINQIRFIRHLTYEQIERTEDKQDHPKIVKKKAGKLLRELITTWIPDLPEQILNYTCEAFANKWKANRVLSNGRYTLHVDDNFSAIYGNDRRNHPCRVTGSCMAGEDQSYFYEAYVNASAAYLTDSEDDDAIVSRCIIFNEVFDEDGNKYRYAERQYSADGDLALKQLLINKLIEAKEIDLFKEVGASYSDVNRIYRVSDMALLDTTRFYIKNTIEPGDTLSFQDTFAWLKGGKAWNYEIYGYDYELNTTSSELEGEWDDYHEYYCSCTVEVNVWNSYYGSWDTRYCDENNLDDFTRDYDDDQWYDEVVECTNGNYYRKDSDHIHYSDRDNCYYHDDDCKYCDITGDYYGEYECVWSDYHNTYLHEDDAIKIGDDYYYKDADCIIKVHADNVVIDGATAYVLND